MKDNFSTGSDRYARFRPTYPDVLYEYLLSIVENREHAWDCGTGNGQVAQRLAAWFSKVSATDISQQQLENAVPREGIEYSVQPAEHTSFPDNSFDLITVAQAIHWFNFDAFYGEVNRTIRDGGVLAVIGYGLLQTTPEIDRVIAQLYRDIVGPYWDKERRYVDEAYRTIPFPYPGLETPPMENVFDWSLDHLMGYLDTWSAIKHYKKEKEQDPVDQVREALEDTWGKGKIRTVRFPILLRVARINRLIYFLLAFVLFMTVGGGGLLAQDISSPADSARRLVDTVLAFAKTRSLYRDRVDWQKVEDSVHRTAAGANNIREVIPSLQLLFRLLGDHHGMVAYKGKIYRGGIPALPLDTPSHRALLKRYYEDYTVSARLLDKGYGYLLIPDNNPMHPGDLDSIAQQLQDSLNGLDPGHLKGLIVDLRLNPGGYVHAMTGGVLNLFEPGTLGSFVDVNGKVQETWGAGRGVVLANTDTLCRLKRVGPPLQGLKVVVLIGPKTMSSGEGLAIAFKSRRNTYFIGENTGGYTTSNNSVQFSDETGVFIASTITADRNGTIYRDYVRPDEIIIGGDNFGNLAADQKVIAALKWLKGAQRARSSE